MGNCINSSLSKTIEHPQLGHLQKQYHQNYSIEYFKATLRVVSRQKYDQWASEVKKIRYNSETKNLLLVPQKMVLQQSDLFKNETQVQVFYEPFIETLQQLILRYRNKSVYPSQELIWYLIYTLVKVGKYFQKINKKIGNMTPSNIVVSLHRQFKVICQKSILEFISSLQQVKLKLSDTPLLAPQEILFLNKVNTKNPEEETNPQLSQVFSIGVLVLGIACLYEPHKFYEYNPEMTKNIAIHFDKIEGLMNNLKKTRRISDQLLQTIRLMIETKPQQRIKSTQLFKRLSQYENQILNKKGLNYSGEQISRIKESLNGSFVSPNLNNSMQTNNRSFHNNTLSFRVSEISELPNETFERQNNSKNFRKNSDFINIL